MCSAPHCKSLAWYTRTCAWAHVRHLNEPSRHSQQSFQAQAHSVPGNNRGGGHLTELQLPKQQVAFHGWMTFKTTNEVYHSSFFLGESLLIFNLSPHRLTQHLCFNLIHSEFVSSMFFLGLNPSSSSSWLLLPWDSVTGLALL